jgi:hypothetical protein
MPLVSLLFVAVLCEIATAGSSRLGWLRSPRVIHAFLVAHLLLFHVDSSRAASVRWLDRSLVAGQSAALQGMWLSTAQRDYYDETALFLARHSGAEERLLVLGYDTNFFFVANRQSAIPENTGLPMFYEAPMPGFDSRARVLQVLRADQVDWILIPVYSEWNHPEGSRPPVEGGASFPYPALPLVAQRYFPPRAGEIMQERFEQVHVTGSPPALPHVHILRRAAQRAAD